MPQHSTFDALLMHWAPPALPAPWTNCCSCQAEAAVSAAHGLYGNILYPAMCDRAFDCLAGGGVAAVIGRWVGSGVPGGPWSTKLGTKVKTPLFLMSSYWCQSVRQARAGMNMRHRTASRRPPLALSCRPAAGQMQARMDGGRVRVLCLRGCPLFVQNFKYLPGGFWKGRTGASPHAPW